MYPAVHSGCLASNKCCADQGLQAARPTVHVYRVCFVCQMVAIALACSRLGQPAALEA